MQIEVYADVVFLVNFIMDFFIFWIVTKLIKKKIKLLNLILGALTASFLYCLLIFTQMFRPIYNIFAVIAILMISIMVCFKPKTIKEFITLIFLTNISAFFIGGLSIALFYFTNISDLLGNMLKFNINNFSFKLLIFSVCSTYIVIKLSISWYKRVIIKKQTFYNIKIYFENESVELNALVDTGNSLHEPISNTPVIVAEFFAIKEFLPDNIKVIYYEKNENDLSKMMECISDKKMVGRMRLIPFSSIGKQNGMLIGFKADKVEILGEKDIILENVIIAIYNFKLSSDGFYNALLNPEIFKEVI